ncbi:641_t:CDS:2 [Ambispora leptoticha]|uniref:641_t:CDS:1 n=1 Tax=Ambispora leptoticha TaxID=144679 RepID=A0A9N8ZWA6_9GLOM|nr:641_t:CDS:2 [Ambispora leptoticha]
MVACDKCFVWQHMECTDYKEEVNSAYLCEQCAPEHHPYLKYGFRTYIEYAKAKKKEPREIQNHQAEQPDHSNVNNTTTTNSTLTNGHSRRRSTARSHSQNDIDFSFESSSPTSRQNANSNTTHRKSSSKQGDHQLNGINSSVKAPKRKQSVSSLSGDESLINDSNNNNHKFNNDIASSNDNHNSIKTNGGSNNHNVSSSSSHKQRTRKSKKQKQQHRIASSSDVELMSEPEELLDISDAQSEIKLSPHSSSVEVHHINGECIHEDREKESNFDLTTKQNIEVKKPKPKRSRSALAAENMTVEQMLERVRRMAQYVEKFENERASRQNINNFNTNRLVSDEEETSGSIKRKSREATSSSALPVLITPSPSDHTMTPEPYFVSSPLECDVAISPLECDVAMYSPPTTENSSEKEGPTLFDQCEELRKRILRFEQTYGDQIRADDEQKIII